MKLVEDFEELVGRGGDHASSGHRLEGSRRGRVEVALKIGRKGSDVERFALKL